MLRSHPDMWLHLQAACAEAGVRRATGDEAGCRAARSLLSLHLYAPPDRQLQPEDFRMRIEKAFRMRSPAFHPDKAPRDKKEAALAAFNNLTNAKETLLSCWPSPTIPAHRSGLCRATRTTGVDVRAAGAAHAGPRVGPPAWVGGRDFPTTCHR